MPLAMNVLPLAIALMLSQQPQPAPAAPAAAPAPVAAPAAPAPAHPGPDVEALKRTVMVESAAVERTPDDTEAMYRLGLAYLTLGDAKRAVKALEQLVQKDPESLDAKLLLARAYRSSGEVDKAKGLVERAILEKPEEPSLHAERAQLARSQDDTDTAVKEYQKAVELSPKDANLIFNYAEAVQKSGKKVDEAIALYRKVIQLDPELTEARVNLGKALAEKGLFGEAKEVLSEVSKTALTDPEPHYNLGVIFMRENNVSNAITEFERALAINPKHAPALNNMGVALDARNDSKKALESFKKAGLADPTYAEAFFNQGMSLMKLNKPIEAAKAFEQALKLEPTSTAPYVQLGTLYLKQGKKDRAVEAFKKALALSDAQEKDASGFNLLRKRFNSERNTDAYRGLALAYLGQGKVDDAVGTLKTAVEKLPKDASAHEALGEAYLAQGNFDGAVEQFKARLSLEDSSEARLDLARAYVKKRVSREAEPLFKQVMKDEPTNRDAKMGLVDLYLAMGRYGEAEQMLTAAIAADAGDAQALSRFGIMKSRMGRPDQALEPLEKAVQVNPLLFDARAEYGFLLFRGDMAGNADRCVQTMGDILTSEPRHTLALHYLGVCMFAKGNKAKAEEAFKAALNVDPNFAPAHFSLGELYEGDNKKDDAKREYELAAKLDHREASDALKRLAGGVAPAPKGQKGPSN